MTPSEASNAAKLIPSADKSDLYKRILDSSGVCYHEIDRNGLIVDVNQVELELLGFALDEMVGKPLWDFVRPADCERIKANINDKLAGELEPSQAEPFTALKRDGTAIPMLAHELPLYLGDGIHGMVVALRNASVGSEIAQALQDPSICAALISQSLPISVIRKDLEGRFLFANPHCCEKLKKTLEEIRDNQTDFVFYPPELARKYREDDRRVIKSGLPYETIEGHQSHLVTEFVQVFKVPTRDADGKIDGIHVMFWALSDRAQVLEAVVRIKELLYRSLVENVPLLIYRKDCGLRFTFVTDRYCKHIGLSRDQILGQRDLDLFPQDLATKYECDDQLVLRGETFDSVEPHKRRQDGKAMFVRVIKTPIRSDDGMIIGIQGVFWDVTTECLALQEVHHRVKNNLAGMWALMVKHKRIAESSETKAALQDCLDHLMTVSKLHQLLYQSNDASSVSAAEFIEAITTTVFDSYRAITPRVQWSLDIEPIQLGLDVARRLGLILTELVANALKHAFHDRQIGTVTVTLRLLSDDHVCLTVADDGVGLPSDWSGPPSTTIGLRAAYDFASALAGEIQVASNNGTRFALTFKNKSGIDDSTRT